MSLRQLDNLVRSETLKREPGDQDEFDGLVASGLRRLTDARKEGLSEESQFDLAYGAAHAFALAAMRWHGYRPNKRRYVVFQALPHTVGLPPASWRVLDKCHNLRNLAEYEGSFEVDRQLLEGLLKATEEIKRAVLEFGPVPSD